MIKHITAVILILLSFGCTHSNSSSETSSSDSIISAFERQLQEDIADDGIEGSISAAVVKDDKIIWSGAFGYSDKNTKEFADTSTIYRTGSITKSFTAFLMMQLAEEGIIKLTDPIEVYLPEIKKLLGYSDSTKITFLQLGTHTSGLIREPMLEDAASGAIENWENKVIESISHTSFESRIGEKFSYSNVGYGILGLALSRAANKPFMELIQEKIFTPLQMNSSYFKVPAEITPRLAKGMNGGQEGLDLEKPNQEHLGRGYKVPNGGIYSTPNDLARFMMANLGYRTLLSPANLKAMQTGEVSHRDDYGLGFFITKEQGGDIISHGGAVAGYSAYFAFETTSGYGVILMRNYNSGKTDLQAQSHALLKELKKLLLSDSSLAQAAYLDEVFKIVEQHSINRDSLDFKKMRRDAYTKLVNAKSITDCYPIIRFVLSELKDHHSFFMEKEKVNEWKSTSKVSNTASLPYSGKVLTNGIGFIEMEGFSSGDSISISEYANNLQKLIKSIDNKNIKGWILDLRQNTGGNCWPMLTGLGPFLGDGICGYFIDNNTNKSSWYYRNGIAGVDSLEICKVKGVPYELINGNNPIAVLTGPRTASSGEVVVTAFRGKSNAKSFGEGTAGLSTGNANYTLSDGSMIFLTTSIYADRQGIAYGGEIKPDNLVQFEYEKLNEENDPVIKRAIDWIQENK